MQEENASVSAEARNTATSTYYDITNHSSVGTAENLAQPIPLLMNRFSKFYALGLTLTALSACSTVTDMITSNLPESHSGRPVIVVSLREQEAYLYRGGHRVASSRISSGREGYRTPTGHFHVTRKDEDHRSSLYGDYVNASGQVVKANVNSMHDSRPPHSHFVGTPMPYFLEFSPGYGLHQGYLPGVPASHGCIRMPYWKARQFYNVAHIGTPVVVKP
jgi:lipoprotein-anchoring transpeptidase ErfK/SrfK